MNSLRFASIAVLSGMLVSTTATASAKDAVSNAEWIAVNQADERSDGSTYSHSFFVDGELKAAALASAVDFCGVRITLNGRPIGGIEPYAPAREWSVREALRPGMNEISVKARRVPGPAAFCLTLSISKSDGGSQSVVTNSEWTVAPSGRAAETRGSAATDLWTSTTPDAAISPFDDYEQWKQALGTKQATDASKFLVPDGYTIELVREAREGEGSWIGLACDPQGRLVIGREDKGLLRVTLPKDDAKDAESKGAQPKVESIEETLLECRGLLFAHGSLYVSANTSKGIYRLRDLDGDDKYEKIEQLIELPGSGGHGRNSLALGPDGRIYSICGDAVQVPRDVDDRTSPYAEHRHVVKTNEGFLLAMDAEGRNVEILATGLRNPYGIAFDSRGEPFTYDADAEKDMGQPWYRPTRVLHLTAGADFGWRGVTGSWPAYYPDHPDDGVPVLDIGKGSPTAVLFGYESRFAAADRQALFILDWSYGRIVRVDLTPRGASYVGHARTFVKGRPFNVTSLAFGPDGAMYVVTGGRKTQSGLYRIRYVGPTQELPEPTVQQAARAAFSAESHAVRRRLEQAVKQPEQLKLDDVVAHLDSADPWIRHAARNALEHLPAESWQARAFTENRPRVAAEMLMSLARMGDETAFEAIARRLNELHRADDPLSVRLTRLYVYQLTLESGRVEAATRTKATALLDAEFPTSSPPHDFLLSRLLTHLDCASAVPKILDQYAIATDQAERLHYLYVLRNTTQGWTPDLRRRYFAALAASRGLTGGEGMPQTYRRLVDDALDSVPSAEREAYATIVDVKPSEEDLAPLVVSRPVVREWKSADEAEILAATDRTPDLARGREMFAAALCIRCHRFGSTGSAIGPDLTGLARRFSRRDMLESILVPSKVVAEQYRTVQITTTDGRLVVGRLAAEEDFRTSKLHIATNPLDPRQIVELQKSDIESHTTTPTSLMPEKLLNTLSREEILDLLAYLETAGLAEVKKLEETSARGPKNN